MNRILLPGLVAIVFTTAVHAQTTTAFVRFRPAEAGFAGSYGEAPSTFSDGKTRQWRFDWNRPLFATVPPIFGGVNVVNSATSESGSFLRIHDNQPVAWPNAPMFYLFSRATSTSVNNVTMLLLWKKEHFPGFEASDVASFDANSSLAVNIPGWAQWTGHQAADIRFVVRNNGQYYVSEATMPGSTGGVFTLTNFVLNPARRWAPVTFTPTSFDLPATLNFAPQAFGNVEAVGWIGRGSRTYTMTYSCASFDSIGVRTSRKMALGQNVNAVMSYGTSHPFVDVMKTASPWRTKSTLPNSAWNSFRQSEIPLDEDGWPEVIPFAAADNSMHIVYTVLAVEVPGSYRLRFQGQGEIRLGYSVATAPKVWRLVTTNPNLNTSESRQAAGSVGGVRFFDTDPITLPQLYDFEIQIVRSDVNDPIRNVELITPGFANADVRANPLLPDFVATLQGFRTLRMLNWNRANDSAVANWAGRPRPTTVFQSSPRGVALEYMIVLCNAVGADIWLCLPHLAGTDRDYVMKTARVLRYGSKQNGEPFDPAVDAPAERAWPPLNPSLKVMVEYSNETWNWVFSQAAFCRDRALLERAAGAPYSPGDDTAGHQFTSVQSARIWGWFDEVFGSEARIRLVRVLASQSAGPSAVSQPRLEAFQNTALVGATQTPDTLAIAPYFGNSLAASLIASGTVETKTMQSIFDDLLAEIHGPLKTVVGQQKALADAHGVWLTCYEAGQHLAARTDAEKNNTALTAKLIAANRDTRMATLYSGYLEMLAGQGIVEMVNFDHIVSPSIHGSWGILESLYQPRAAAPKFAPIMDWASTSRNVNHPPALELRYPVMVIDADGNGSEIAELSAAGSIDFEGRIASYLWNIRGSSLRTATVNPTLPVGRTDGTVAVTDDAGLTQNDAFSILVRPQGSDTPMLTASFVSANATEYPGVIAGTTPWTKSSFLAPGVVFEGWRWVPRTDQGQTGILSGDTVANALGVKFYHNALTNAGAPSTFAQAIAGNQYLSCTIRPSSGKTLDLRGAEVTWTLRSFSDFGARSTALLTSVGGFTQAAAIHRVEQFAAGTAANPRTHTFTAHLPVDPAYQTITGPIEIRLYLWGTLYTNHATHLTGFNMTGRVR